MAGDMRENEATRTADAFNALADRLEKLLNEHSWPRGPRGGRTIDARSIERPPLRLVVDNERKAA
jgi:hypothetical protein